MKRHGINNTNTILSKWEANGFLIRNEGDRRQVRKTIDGQRDNFYVLRLDRELLMYMPMIATFLGSPNTLDMDNSGSILTLQGSKYSGMNSDLMEAANE